MTATATPEVGTPPEGGRRGWRQRRHWLATADGRAVAILVVVPLVVFVVPALAGRPAIAADNLIQNFPLRALSGADLRAGHLPLWNPYIWSGSPLLGGLNAGSFYPLTFVFAVLPPVAAWVVNMLGTYWAAGLGLYALGRSEGLRPAACLVAGLTYAFAGTMSGQMVHLGVVQGMGWAPLLVLAQLRLARTVREGTSPWRWVVLLAAVIGLEALTGEPRAIAETEILAGAVTLWELFRPGWASAARRLRFLGLSALAGLWGVALAAAELAPGWSFITASQRSVESYQFFGSGSLPLKWTALLFVPDLFGGNGIFEQPSFFNNYNLPEVTGYVGLLALGAALVLASRSFGRRRAPGSARWGLWLALLVLGLFLAWGTYTPLGHVWVLIPLFGKTRLQSRNLGIVDLALTVLLAFWADRALAGRAAEAGLSGWRRWLLAAPALVALVLCVGLLADPVPIEEWLGTSAAGGAMAHYLMPWLVGQAVVSAAVVGLVFGWHRLPALRRPAWLGAVVAVDVLLFAVATATGYSAGTASLQPSRAQAVANVPALGRAGRFAIVEANGINTDVLSTIGQPDLNAFTTLRSAQGYGSIVSDAYATATGTHTLDSMTACDLASGVFDPLRLSTVLVSPGTLGPGPPASGPPVRRPACAGAPLPGTATHRVLYLGFPLVLSSAHLVAVPHVRASGAMQVRVLGERGGVHAVPVAVVRTASGWSVVFDHPVLAYGLVLDGPVRAVADTSTVTGTQPPGRTTPPAATTAPGQWTFNGYLQNALGQPAWHYVGIWRTFSVFTRAVRPPVWLAGSPSGSSVTQVRSTSWGTEVDRVVAAGPVTVVRSEAYLQGWNAEATPAGGGPGRAVPVVARGLVQSVRLPPGSWILTFRYRAPRLSAGLAATGLALAAFAAAGGWALVLRRRRRRAG